MRVLKSFGFGPSAPVDQLTFAEAEADFVRRFDVSVLSSRAIQALRGSQRSPDPGKHLKRFGRKLRGVHSAGSLLKSDSSFPTPV